MATGLALAGFVALLVRHFRWARSWRDEAVGRWRSLDAAALVSLAVAIWEEVLFRGVALPRLGLLASAGLFAACHLGPKLRHQAWAVFAFGCGLIFGAFTLRTGDLTAAIAAHATLNLALLAFVAR